MADTYTHMSIQSFFESLAASTPTPGGGSVAALSGALAASLILMVCNLTIDKKKATHHELSKIKEETTRLRSELLAAVDKDIAAYEAVVACYQLPRKTESDKAKRTEALQAALVQAVEIPYDIASACSRLLELCQPLTKIGNPNAISDIAVAAYLADAAVQSALCNVEINCKQITDTEFVHRHHGLSKTLSEQATARKERVLNVVKIILDN